MTTPTETPSGITAANEYHYKKAEKATTKTWTWLSSLDLGAVHRRDFGETKRLAHEEKRYPLGTDPVDVPEERIEDGGTGTMLAAGAAVGNAATTGVQREIEVVTEVALTDTMTEISRDAAVDLLGAEAEGLVDVSPVTMN